MLLETGTSIYRLEEKKSGGFRLTKIALKTGESSRVEVGQSFEGDGIVITPLGIEIGDIKTSPLLLPVAD
jgi:hypothetical protein